MGQRVSVLDINGSAVLVRIFVESAAPGRTIHDFGGRFALSSSQLGRLSRLNGRFVLSMANGGDLEVAVTGNGAKVAFGRDGRHGTFAYAALVEAGLVTARR